VHAAWPQPAAAGRSRADYSPGTMVATDAIFTAGTTEKISHPLLYARPDPYKSGR